jgi:hypothetical protein
MDKLIQLVYISRSTEQHESNNNIPASVARILLKSRTNNVKNNIVGVLYFSHNCFYQCIEGTESAIDTLYEKLLQDPRHKDLKIIHKQSIDSLSFSKWSMKFVPLEQKMMDLLQLKGYQSFNPYAFDDQTHRQVIGLLQSSKGE